MYLKPKGTMMVISCYVNSQVTSVSYPKSRSM